jgi:hypothetical protein
MCQHCVKHFLRFISFNPFDGHVRWANMGPTQMRELGFTKAGKVTGLAFGLSNLTVEA